MAAKNRTSAKAAEAASKVLRNRRTSKASHTTLVDATLARDAARLVTGPTGVAVHIPRRFPQPA
jgi:hypothetical protein